VKRRRFTPSRETGRLGNSKSTGNANSARTKPSTSARAATSVRSRQRVRWYGSGWMYAQCGYRLTASRSTSGSAMNPRRNAIIIPPQSERAAARRTCGSPAKTRSLRRSSRKPVDVRRFLMVRADLDGAGPELTNFVTNTLAASDASVRFRSGSTCQRDSM
jgi:hypothetical protein